MLDEILNELNKQDEQKAKREKKIPKPVTLESELERLEQLKWKTDMPIFQRVKEALLSKELIREGTGKLKKDDIYQYHKIILQREREKKQQEVRENKPDNYYIIQDMKSWYHILTLLDKEEIVAVDTETTGLNPYTDKIVAVCLYLPKANIAAYIPFGHKTGEKQLREIDVIAPLKDYLEDTSLKTCWHNGKYDLHMFEQHGVHIQSIFWDSLVAGRLLNEHEESHGLKQLYSKYCNDGTEVAHFDELFENHDIANTDILLAGTYGCFDAYMTYTLYRFQEPFINTRGNLKTVFDIERRLVPVDVRLERTGLHVNVKRLHEIELEQIPRIEKAEQDLKEFFKINDDFLKEMSKHTKKEVNEFNFSSNDHLGYLLYDKLGVGSTVATKLGKTNRSTAADVIDTIIEETPELKPLLEYREASKIVSTYARKIPEALEIDGLLHSQFDSQKTRTGRYASLSYGNKNDKKGTNLQNIPSRTALGKEIRKCIIPTPHFLFVGSDLSQIEPRIIAHILYTWCNDSSMRDLYIAQKDLYTNMAMSVFNLPYESCVDGAKIYNEDGSYWEPRKVMKTGVLACLYGQSPKSFSNKMGVTLEVAERFFEGMKTSFPGLEPFRQMVLKKLLNEGYAETLFGRKRRFPEYSKKHARLQQLNRKVWQTLSNEEKEERSQLWKFCSSCERESINTVVQGTAADTLKQIIIAMSNLCVEKGWKYVMSIHDEVKLELPQLDITLENIEKINKVMTESVKFSVPLKCDTVLEYKWQEEYKVKDWDFDKGEPKSLVH